VLLRAIVSAVAGLLILIGVGLVVAAYYAREPALLLPLIIAGAGIGLHFLI
jgi:hypothetical protein